MIVTETEYADIHNVKRGTVGSWIARGKLTVVRRDSKYAYLDSEERPHIASYAPIYGDQSRLLAIFRQMKTRCYNKNNPSYPRYGKKGIKICDEWMNDRRTFVEWALSHGYKEGLTIDRIDPDKGYSPDNCQWLTRSENSHKKKLDNQIRKMKKLS